MTPEQRKEYMKIYRAKNKDKIAAQTKEYREKHKKEYSAYWQKYWAENKERDVQKIYFRTKAIALDYNPKVGVCNTCRAVVGFDCKHTSMHHEQYDESNPTAHTIEVCVSCHNKTHIEKKRLALNTN